MIENSSFPNKKSFSVKLPHHCFFFGDVTNKLNNNPPIKPPYSVLFNGFEVMAHVPDAHPIC